MSVAVDEETFWLGDWRVEPQLNRIVRGEEIVKIDPRNMNVLQLLATRPGKVFSQAEIEEAVWSDVVVTSNSVYQSIAQLRRALGDDSSNPRYIRTISRRGYQMIAEVAKRSERDVPRELSDEHTPRRSVSLTYLTLAIAAGVSLIVVALVLVPTTQGSTSSAATNNTVASVLLGEAPASADFEPRILREVAALAISQGNPRDAREHLVKAIELEKTHVGDSQPIIGELLSELANVYVWEGNYAAAESVARDGLRAFSGLSELHPDRINAMAWLGYVLLEAGKYSDSEAYLSKALELSTQVFGDRSITRSQILNDMAILRFSQARLPEAELLVHEALQIAQQSDGNASAITRERSTLIRILLEQGRYSEARNESRTLLTTLEELRDNHPQVVAARDLLARSLIGLREYSAAESILRENIRLWHQHDGWSDREAASSSILGEALLGQGRLAEAEEYLVRASLHLRKSGGRQEQQYFREHNARVTKLRIAQQYRNSDALQVAELEGL